MGVEDYNKQQLARLREHKIAFDQEAMWAAMQKKKKRRGALYFFTMALVALAIVFFTYCTFTEKIGENSWFNKENISEEKLLNLSTLENERNGREDVSEITNLTLDDNKAENEVSQIEDSGVDADLGTRESVNKSQSSTGDNIQRKKTNDLKSRDPLKRKLANTYDSNTEASSSTKIRTSESENQDIKAKTSEITKTINNSNIKTSISNTDKTISIAPLQIFEFPFLKSLRKIDLDKLEMTAPVITEVIKEPKSRLHIGAYGGAGYLFRQSSIENDTSRQNSKTLEEISIGLELKYQLTPNFFVRSGVEYWHATERKETSSYTIMNTNELETFVPGEEGIIITNKYSKIHTIYQSYNIPAVLGWNTNNDNWNLFAEAGVLYNFRVDRRKEESFATTEVNQFGIGSQNQISPIAGIGISFSPTNKIELFARSNWRGSQFVTDNESRESLKYGALRTQLGVRIGI